MSVDGLRSMWRGGWETCHIPSSGPIPGWIVYHCVCSLAACTIWRRPKRSRWLRCHCYGGDQRGRPVCGRGSLVTRGILPIAAHMCVSGCSEVESPHHLFLSRSTFGPLWTLVHSWTVTPFSKWFPDTSLRSASGLVCFFLITKSILTFCSQLFFLHKLNIFCLQTNLSNFMELK
jgi:hypothetical protein